ncbi:MULTISPECIES: hypothetical protein [unclassified Pseudonocardia]|uniref:hypothetical protein n=1 Tax=unclassified Pseudonocardia TaxID=2619320 RepID=UPI00143C5997|nr:MULTISPECIES: hypothetical protein [unclassified Pseudonocardia]
MEFDMSDEGVKVSDQYARITTRRTVARHRGRLIDGSSSDVVYEALFRLASLPAGATMAAFVNDGDVPYMGTVLDDDWRRVTDLLAPRSEACVATRRHLWGALLMLCRSMASFGRDSRALAVLAVLASRWRSFSSRRWR